MIARVVTEKLAEIRAACEKHKVRTLWLFGSATTDEFDPARSDLDFLVEFEPGVKRGAFDDVYFLLLDDLRAIFGRKIDLAELKALRNPYMIKAIESTRMPVYAAA